MPRADDLSSYDLGLNGTRCTTNPLGVKGCGEAGKNADIAVIKGNPASKIDDIEKVEIVFKDGVGYDSQKLFDSVRGRYGQY